MSGASRAQRFQLEAAERRVVEQLKVAAASPSPTRVAVVVVVAALLFAASFVARLAVNDPDALLANLYVVPTVVLAVEFGTRGGIAATVISLGLVFAWGAIETIHVSALGYVSRAAVVLVAGVVVGRFSERLRADVAERHQAQRHLAVYADQLERANQHLARSVEQLEAFAEIARAVGGETDLERVLSLILEHGREIIDARILLVYLPDGDDLVALGGPAPRADPPPRIPIAGSLPGEVLVGARPRRASNASQEDQERLGQLAAGAREAILVPLVFRGETLGVLVGIDGPEERPFGEEDEQLLVSIAASAATAVATARSVAAARLRLSLEAADQARARWARELHDETLQGLTGVRMVLSAARARDDLEALRRAVDAADSHLADELRNLRDLIAELRPAALDDLGLGPAIESLAKRQAAIGGFTVDLRLGLDSGGRLPRDTETAIYRIAQEALTNAVKHAEATRVQLSVEQQADHIELAVQDDGRGFEPSRTVEGFGLTGMHERAVLAGGHLSVTSEDGGPTCVTAVLPL